MKSRAAVWTVVAAAAVVAVALPVIVTAGFGFERGETDVRASSVAPGTSAADLLGDARQSATEAAWRSHGESVGSWVEIGWRDDRTVGRVVIEPSPLPEERVAAWLLTFTDGDELLVHADEEGRIDRTFPARTTTSVRLVAAEAADGAEGVGAASMRFDGDGGGFDQQRTASVAVSSTAGAEGEVLGDGDLAAGDGGAGWQPSADDPAPWVEVRFGTPREVASVQILGPDEFEIDPTYSAAAPLFGYLVFDDGSRVVVSGVAPASEGPTTVAFAPRVVSTVRFEIERTVPTAVVGLQEFLVHDVGTTPPRWPGSPTLETADTAGAVSCADSTADPVGKATAALALACPSPGAAVGNRTTVVVSAPAGAAVEASAWLPATDARLGGAPVVVGSASADAGGRAVMDLDLSQLPSGPTSVRVVLSKSEPAALLTDPLYVQLWRTEGERPTSPSTAPSGMTLQWEEEFDAGVSATQSGAGADLAATKPAYWGTSEFGAAVFSDPAWKNESITTADGYLRLRAQPLDRVDPFGWDRAHMSGILSSLRIGASGFSAQYGYYEARILGAPGKGAWPAFWMLNTESAARRATTSGEVDAVELYGHNTNGSCHSLHNWVEGEDEQNIDCIRDNGFGDWAMAWHTYGVRIGPDGAQYSIDGTVVSEARGLQHSDEPFYFMLNLALDGGWPVDLAPTGDVTDMYVDWVRVYT